MFFPYFLSFDHKCHETKQTYHLDYAFGSKALKIIPNSFELGLAKDWINISDHLPISFLLE